MPPFHEYRHIHQRQKRLPTLAWWIFISAMVQFKKRRIAPIDQSMNVLFGDGSPIPAGYVKIIEDIIWKNMVMSPRTHGHVPLRT